MWKSSFVATTVAMGTGTLDEALAAVDDGRLLDAQTTELVKGLRSAQRPARAVALARAVQDIVLAIDGVTLK